jgi:hypothetical protein
MRPSEGDDGSNSTRRIPEQRKAIIKNADMDEAMQQDAVDIASQAMSKYNIEKVKYRFTTEVVPAIQRAAKKKCASVTSLILSSYCICFIINIGCSGSYQEGI